MLAKSSWTKIAKANFDHSKIWYSSLTNTSLKIANKTKTSQKTQLKAFSGTKCNLISYFSFSCIKSSSNLLYKPSFTFSSDKNDNNKKDQNNNEGISLYEIFQMIEKFLVRMYGKMKSFSFRQWGFALALPLMLYFLLPSQNNYQAYPRNIFEDELRNGTLYTSQFTVQIRLKKNKTSYFVIFQNDIDKINFVDYGDNLDSFKAIISNLREKPNIKYTYKSNYELKTSTLILLLEIFSCIAFTYFFIRTSSLGGVKKKNNAMGGLGMLGQGKSFQIIKKTSVKFKDVAGLDQSKVQVKQFVDFLKNPQKYRKLGARIPKGVLLTGPPGTGKTLLAKACAGEAGVPFIATSGSDFVQIFVGLGASRVRQLFALAKKSSPAIIFIDEIDAVGRKRGGGLGGHDERDNTLNQILVEMDGFETDQNVIVMAATNRQNLLDDALVRPGRFDRIVEVNLPDLQGRRQIFNVHLQRVNIQNTKTKDQYARRLATLTPGFSGAQIANLCNQAAILAARNNKDSVSSQQLQMATQRIIGGIQRKSIISIQEKRIVSVHESGHAVTSWFLQGADPLLKLTIIPRSKGSLGFAQYFVNQTKLNTRSQLIDRICFILGGRCAEQLFFKQITNGASDDLRKAYEIAHNIVVKLGMDEQIGYVGFKDPQYLRPYSQEMATKIDRQIQKIIAECTQKTRKLVRQHQHHIKALSDQLYDKQTLTIKQIRRILGQRQYLGGQSYQKYLEIEHEDMKNIQQVNSK